MQKTLHWRINFNVRRFLGQDEASAFRWVQWDVSWGKILLIEGSPRITTGFIWQRLVPLEKIGGLEDELYGIILVPLLTPKPVLFRCIPQNLQQFPNPKLIALPPALSNLFLRNHLSSSRRGRQGSFILVYYVIQGSLKGRDILFPQISGPYSTLSIMKSSPVKWLHIVL